MRHLATVVALSVFVTACGSTPAPTAPSGSSNSTATSLSLNGTFSGPTSDSSGAGTMTWVVTQSGGSVSGHVNAKTPLGIVAFDGTVAGTLSGTSLTFIITVPSGGISGLPGCSATINGTAAGISNTAISGTYTGTNSCAASFDGGHLTLAKQ